MKKLSLISIYLFTLLGLQAYSGTRNSDILYSLSFETETPEGFASFEQALHACQRQRQLYLDSYFFVYCTFHKKNWTEIHIARDFMKDYKMLGYTTRHNKSSSSRSASASQSQSLSSYVEAHVQRRRRSAHGTASGQIDQSASAEANSSSSDENYHQTPEVRSIQVPYQYLYEENFKAYGLQVHGLGAVDENSPWKILLSSNQLANGFLSRTFNSEITAYIECQKALVAVRQSKTERDLVTYHRAVCQTNFTQNGDFYYQIVTQNPFAGELL